MKGKAMNRIGFDIGGDESDQEEPQVGYVDSGPVDEEESSGFTRWLYSTGMDFLVVYGLVMGIKNIINFMRKE